MLKFLEIVWKLDASCGEADYEMESDTAQGQIYFERRQAWIKKRKIEVFQEKLSELVATRALTTDKDVFLHCLTSGFLPRIAKDVYCAREDGLLKNEK